MSAYDGDEFSTEYWLRHMELDNGRPVLEPMPKPCHDCAVLGGLYYDLAVSLQKQSDDIKKRCSETWFCHSDPRRACRGNWDMQYPENK